MWARLGGLFMGVHDSLRFHLLEAHWKMSPFKCKLCSYSAIRPSQVSLHARMVHNHNNNRIDDVELIPEVFRIIEEKENE